MGHLARVLLRTLLEYAHTKAILLVGTLFLRLVEALAIDSLAVS